MMTVVLVLLREVVGVALAALMQPSADEIRRIVREEMEKAALIILDPLSSYEEENETLEPPQ